MSFIRGYFVRSANATSVQCFTTTRQDDRLDLNGSGQSSCCYSVASLSRADALLAEPSSLGMGPKVRSNFHQTICP